MTVMTLKVPQSLDHKLRAVAKRRGVSKSAVVRKAVETYIEHDLPIDDEPSAYDLLCDVVGSVNGPGDLSHSPKHMKEYGR